MTALRERLRRIEATYQGERDRPLGPFMGLMATYSGTVVALGLVAHHQRRLPTRLSGSDAVLFSIATHKVARLLSKDPITSPLRAPFTKLEGTTGPAELHERVRGSGWQRAVGELVSCPFCLGQWTATGFLFGSMWMPRFTRLVAATFAVHAVADALQFGYAALERTDR